MRLRGIIGGDGRRRIDLTENGTAEVRASFVRDVLGSLPGLDARIVEAFRSVDRAAYLDRFRMPGKPDWIDASQPLSAGAAAAIYRDQALATLTAENGMPSSSSTTPSLMLLMLHALSVAPGDRVLEIGTATGYNAALLAHLVTDAGSVVTIDSKPEIAARAAAALETGGITNVQVRAGDGGAAEEILRGVFDRLIATVGCATVPSQWWDCLTEDGVAVVPLRHGEAHPLCRLRKGTEPGHWYGAFTAAANFMLADGDTLHRPRGAEHRVQLTEEQHLLDTGLGCHPSQGWAVDFFLALQAPHLKRITVKTAGPTPQIHAGCGIADQHGNIVLVSWGRLMATTGPDSPAVRELAGHLTAWKNLGCPSIGHYDIEILPHNATDIPTPLAGRRWTQPDRHATRIVTLRT
ncbi:protein-L-isoaspartate O-methyltransferase family protein [Rhodococcus opacus]|uniref:protein-L-isoaspartate O-methyltransferase family protein n=1 Tax=Rhodococcus opacus TaxID=37919 RepID=UPI002F3E5B94